MILDDQWTSAKGERIHGARRASWETAGQRPSSAIVIVTHNRVELLTRLLESIDRARTQPDLVVVVDNASTDSTRSIVLLRSSKPRGYEFVFQGLNTNLGGAGGFYIGIAEALAGGAEWLWLLDDDVEVLPDGLAGMFGWTDRFKCIQGSRCDWDGAHFHWQPHFSEWLAVPLPRLGTPFSPNGYFLTNCGCFEGMLIHRDIVEQIGLPDPRFVITWDDAIYGWLASQVTEVACVETLVLRRIRRQRKISLVVRHLSEASDVARYHSMRNRAYVAHYFRRHGAFHPVGFRFGTALSFCKEVFRLVAVERSVSLNSLSSLVRGIADGRRLMRDATWQPMPPLTTDYYRSGQQ